MHERVDLAQAIESWMPSLQETAGPDVRVELSLAGQSRPMLADLTMIREALLNLVDNAVSHGGDGVTQIEISLTYDDRAVSLVVADNGCGIPDDRIAVAMNRFAQLSTAEGSGLGLPIVAAIVEAHGGEISLSSPGTGLSVRCVFPI